VALPENQGETCEFSLHSGGRPSRIGGMSDPPTLSPAPSTPSHASRPALGPRVDSLDLLRGVAILGIFLMNTQSMLLPQNAYVNPASFGDFTGGNFWAYVFTHIVADMKFITIFSFMFGAGILLQGERVASRGMSPWLTHYLRMSVLLVIGMIHAYAIWYGDILTTYACCGLLLYPLKRLPGAALVGLGLLMVLVQLPVNTAIMTDRYHFFPLEGLQQYHYAVTQGMDDASELAAYTGPLSAELAYRARMSWDGQTTVFLTWTLWRCGGCILIGMGLHRWRFFHGADGGWGKPAYAALAIFGIGLGWTVTTLGIFYNAEQEWDNYPLWRFGVHFNYVGSMLAALGYMAVGVLVADWAGVYGGSRQGGAGWLNRLLGPIRAVGKTALSNYLFQSLVGTTLAYAHIVTIGDAKVQLGLGWMGKVSRAGLLPIVLVTWAVQLALSVWWLRHHRQGPFEWAWHKLVYLGRPYPVRPQEAAAPVAKA
jgi:uncharacterized protein